MENIILQGVTAEELITRTAERVLELMDARANRVEDKWLSTREARNQWVPAIARNTLVKYSKMYGFPARRWGGKLGYNLKALMKGKELIKTIN